jgi:parkin
MVTGHDPLQECDLGQQSVLHAVKSRPSTKSAEVVSTSEGSRPLNETLIDLQLSDHERHSLKTDEGE